MTNIRLSTEKPSQNIAVVRVLPFEEYIQSITDSTERRLLFDKTGHQYRALRYIALLRNVF